MGAVGVHGHGVGELQAPERERAESAVEREAALDAVGDPARPHDGDSEATRLDELPYIDVVGANPVSRYSLTVTVRNNATVGVGIWFIVSERSSLASH